MCKAERLGLVAVVAVRGSRGAVRRGAVRLKLWEDGQPGPWPWSRIVDRRRVPYYCYWRVGIGIGSPGAAAAETLEISTSRARAMR